MLEKNCPLDIGKEGILTEIVQDDFKHIIYEKLKLRREEPQVKIKIEEPQLTIDMVIDLYFPNGTLFLSEKEQAARLLLKGLNNEDLDIKEQKDLRYLMEVYRGEQLRK